MFTLLAILKSLQAFFGFGQAALREIHDAKQRKAGSDASQVESNNAEINRVNNAADAAQRLPDVKTDPNNLNK